MVDSLRFDDKFFQRGQTWSECLSSWEEQRLHFLVNVQEAPLLPQFSKSLAALSGDTRLVVWFDQWRTDAQKILPALGKTLFAAPGVTARFFEARIFFPALHSLGRQMPKLALLDDDGFVACSWGPRPDEITRKLSEIKGCEKGQLWLQGYDQAHFHQLLDEALTRFTASWQTSCVTR